MATLTSTYQYLGRSTAMVSNNSGSNYYILLYGKTVANNTTGFHTVSIRQVLACGNVSTFYQYSTNHNGQIDGTQVFSGTNKPDQAWETTSLVAGDVTYPRWTVIGEGSTKVDCTDGKTHNIKLSTYWKLNEINVNAGYLPKLGPERTVAVTATLPAIPRATEIDSFSCATSYLDGTLTYKYTPQSASYYNRMTLNILVDDVRTEIRTTNLGKKSAAQQTATTVFTSAELSAIYAKIPSAASVTVQLRIGTYADSEYSTKIGDTQKSSITLTVPTAVKPTVSMTASPVNDNAWISARKIYVAGYSGATFAVTAKAGESAKLTSTSITTPDGVTYEATKLNVELLKDEGSLKFTAKAIDSRKRSASASKTITVLPYSVPTITTFNAERGTYSNGWTASDNGPDVKVQFKASLSLADNGNVYKAAFKLDGATATPTGTTSGLASGTAYTVYFKAIDGEKSHSLKLTATDSVGNGITVGITIPTINITVEYNESGKGLALGKPSERDAFECAWPAFFSDSVYINNKITCPNAYSLRDFNINCNWADGAAHDMIARANDGLTVRLGWSGDAEDGTEHETVLDVRPKKSNFRGTVTAPRGRFTATTDSSGTEQNNVALRIGDEDGQHIDIDTNEIQAKDDPTTPGDLYLNLDGGRVYAGAFRIPEILCGSVSITPSAANTPASIDITFEREFSGKPVVVVTAATSVPGTTVIGAGVNSISATGCTLWATRTNTTVTVLNWIAIY